MASQNLERPKTVRHNLTKKIFTAVMEDILKKLNLQERGLNVDGKKLTNLKFADDVALIATSVKQIWRCN